MACGCRHEEAGRPLRADPARLGTPAALVNNAGIVAPPSRLQDMDGERIERITRLNVLGTFFCAREAVRVMSRRHRGTGGAIVNVSSGATKVREPSRVRRLRGVQGSRGGPHHWTGQGGRCRRDQGEHSSPWRHRDRDPRQKCPAGQTGEGRSNCASRPGGPARGSGGRHFIGFAQMPRHT
jgi:NAD(P)-dependent dehydrogenase (short-subunit alcohol dehydrogenase family)